MRAIQYYHYDVMVIGGGQAALASAISAKEEGASVALVTKGKAGLGGSSVISDSVHSAIFSPEDSPEQFIQDIVEGGRHLSDKRLARALAEECTVRVNELESKFGISLEREKVIITPGHSQPRRVYAGTGLGKNITKPMRDYAIEIGIDFHEQSAVVDLIKDNNEVKGALIQNSKEFQIIYSPAVILATGGFGGLYQSSDNPRDVSGEGIGMAWRHGAILVDMEFVQFYPYRLQQPANVDVMTKIFAKGAFLVNEKSERFMEKFPKKELETRDTLSYAMYKEDKVLIDFSGVAEKVLQHDSPYLYRLYQKGNSGEWIMSPVQHYCMGGIQTDEWGRTNIPGLYACGEVTGGLHGANRLGGGSLTESLVFGYRAGKMAVQEKSSEDISGIMNFEIHELINNPSNIDESEIIKKVKEIMWKKVGIERTSRSLEEAADELNLIALNLEKEINIQALQLRDKVRAAWASASAAAARKESRGAHKLQDIKEEKKEWEGKNRIHKTSIQFTPAASRAEMP
ncbi:FAD-binding protein [Bacillus sp. ISL-47]|uniref:FAD-binding protein n=1 Tax=Bacillus sp. ISL-47 TaxID=2819130 RepID=UPI001BE58D88|nr:FAD-binding protein [Bacillus sp. ISL-47]MBT2689829.1 FAD-binding protein [Bacillus sp. ISL-47]MBT2709277.1 FAD-binding protein [Pseudomonas sp. ISL-84]